MATVGEASLIQKVKAAERPAAAAFCALLAFGPVIGLASAQGGFFPTAWGWASIPLLWVVAVLLILRVDLRLSALEGVFIAAFAGLTCWTAASVWWSVSGAQTVLEVERLLVYVAAVAAVILAARTKHIRIILGAVLAAVTLVAAFGLATRLLPDRVGVFDRTSGYRLAQPIGYWNGLALFAAMGALLAIGFVARARTIGARSASAASLVVLLPTFYFTFGRAAWIALFAGFLFAVAVDPRRLQFLAASLTVLPAPALAVWLSSRSSGLTHPGVSLSAAAHDGHRVAVAVLLLALANAGAAAVFAFAEARADVGPAVRMAFGAVALFAAVGVASLFLVRVGGPVALFHKGYKAFKAPPPQVTGSLNRRLLSFSGNGRADLWRLAWDDARRHPVLGAGAGAYERYFLAHQPAGVGRVRDAHGLYIETLAELGPLGLAVLLAALFAPLSALPLARGHPLVPAAAGAYVAYLVHAGVDWDWELAGVTVVGVLCGAAILVGARRYARTKPLSRRTRWIGVGAAVVAAMFAAIALVGNAALSHSESARERGDVAKAAEAARRAHKWMPWSPQPWVALGRAQMRAGATEPAAKSFRKALSLDDGDWEVWYDLSRVTSGRERTGALRHVATLYPRSGLTKGTGSP